VQSKVRVIFSSSGGLSSAIPDEWIIIAES
jgi:hypothetical protein